VEAGWSGLRGESYEAVLVSVNRKFETSDDAELGEDRAEVLAHGGLADGQPSGDRSVLEPLPHQGYDLARRQRSDLGCLGACRRPDGLRRAPRLGSTSQYPRHSLRDLLRPSPRRPLHRATTVRDGKPARIGPTARLRARSLASGLLPSHQGRRRLGLLASRHPSPWQGSCHQRREANEHRQ
jgi:hypothetical protein